MAKKKKTQADPKVKDPKILSPDMLKDYKARLLVACGKHDSELKGSIERFRRYYKGDQWSGGGTAQYIVSYTDKIVDNVIFSNIQTIRPAINFKNPKIFASPKKKPFNTPDGALFDTIAGSVVFEHVMNYYYETLELKRQIDKILTDALIGPWGFIYLGHTLETEKIESKTGKEIEIHELIRKNSPFAVRLSPMDVRIDSEAKDHQLEDASWVAIRWVKPLLDVQANPKYSDTEKIKANFTPETKHGANKSGGMSVSADMESVGSNGLWERVEGWDIWDRKNNKLVTVVIGHDKPLQYRDWPLHFNGGFPIESLYFNENPDELFPISDVEIYISAQDELNRLHSLMLSHIKRISQRKYVTKRNALTPNEKLKLTHGGDGTIIETSKGSPFEAIHPIQDANISQDVYMVTKLLKNDIREASGVSQFEKGAQAKFETATEPALIQQGIGQKRDEKAAILEDFIVRTLKKLASILQETMGDESIPLSDEQVTEVGIMAPNKLESIVGPSGTVLLPWLNMNKDDIQGDYLFTLEVGSTRPISQEIRKADAVQMYQMFGQHPLINQKELVKRVLDGFQVKELEKLMKTDDQLKQETEQQVKQQQMMAQMALQAEQAKEAPKLELEAQKAKLDSDTKIHIAETSSEVSLLTAGLQQEAAKSKADADRAKKTPEVD